MSAEDLATEFLLSVNEVIEEFEVKSNSVEFFDHAGKSFLEIEFDELPPGSYPTELRLELSAFLSAARVMDPGRYRMVE